MGPDTWHVLCGFASVILQKDYTAWLAELSPKGDPDEQRQNKMEQRSGAAPCNPLSSHSFPQGHRKKEMHEGQSKAAFYCWLGCS